MQINLFSRDMPPSWTPGVGDIAVQPLEWKASLEEDVKAMAEYESSGIENLKKTTEGLVAMLSQIISIDEAHKSRDLGSSMRRLSWITASPPPALCLIA